MVNNNNNCASKDPDPQTPASNVTKNNLKLHISMGGNYFATSNISASGQEEQKNITKEKNILLNYEKSKDQQES